MQLVKFSIPAEPRDLYNKGLSHHQTRHRSTKVSMTLSNPYLKGKHGYSSLIVSLRFTPVVIIIQNRRRSPHYNHKRRRLSACRDTGLDVVPLEVIGIVGLNIGSEAVEGALDGLLGGRVHHASLKRVSVVKCTPTAEKTHVLASIIRGPANEGDFVALALAALQLVLDIEDGIAATNAFVSTPVLALCRKQLLTESAVVGIGRLFFNDNLFPVVADLVDDPFQMFSKLKLVEDGDALGSDGNAGRSLEGPRISFWLEKAVWAG